MSQTPDRDGRGNNEQYPDAVTVGTYREPTLPDQGMPTAGGEASLPLRGEDSILTSRSFCTGKSGAGKSNTVNVIAEEVLRANRPLAIIDTDGEYFGLKESFEMLHVGADDECDLRVGPEHGEKLAELAIEQNTPLIIDISGFLDESDANDLLLDFTRTLFGKAKRLKKPFPLIVEEAHEYIPQQGSAGDLGRMIVKIAKRGRKHGLGLIAVSQRPASVEKDFITQANLVIWHRLTWNNDTRVASDILGSGFGDRIEDLNDGEAFLMADWERDIRRVQFRRQDTYDAGATPTLEGSDTPDLKTVSDELIEELEATGQRQQTLEDELDALREERDELADRVDELEEALETRDHAHEEFQESATTFAKAVENALTEIQIDGETSLEPGDGGWDSPAEIRAEVMRVVRDTAEEELAGLQGELEEKKAELESVRQRVANAEATIEKKDEKIADLERQVADLEETEQAYQRLQQRHEELQEIYHRLGDALGVETDKDAQRFRERAKQEQERADALENILRGDVDPSEASVDVDVDVKDTLDEQGDQPKSVVDSLEHPEVENRIEQASEEGRVDQSHYLDILYVLAEVVDGDHPVYDNTEGSRPSAPEIARDSVVEVAESTVYAILKALVGVGLVEKHDNGPDSKNTYGLNLNLISELDASHARRRRRESFRDSVGIEN